MSRTIKLDYFDSNYLSIISLVFELNDPDNFK